MDWRKYAFISIITLIMIVHVLFTHIHNITKNDFGKQETVLKICQVADKIKSDYSNLKCVGFMAEDSSGMDYLSAYYQWRYCLAPVHVSRSQIRSDTFLIQIKNPQEGRYKIIKKYDHGYTLIVK